MPMLIAISVFVTSASVPARGVRAAMRGAEIRRLEHIPGFDFGNSPREVAEPAAVDSLILTTTNGTRLLVSASTRFERVYVGSLLNLDAVAAAAAGHGEDVAVLCAGVLGELALD